jgi:predicted dehydrogenase
MDRRKFLASSLSAPAILRGQAARKYRTALVGSGWWGMNILESAMQSGQGIPVALCDVDASQLDKAAARVRELSGAQPKRYKDYRELLHAEKPEIVIVATPDHWHALPTIDAVKAGAHVLVEKPIGHTILEGTAMVKAARDTGRVIQVGLHRRVSPHKISAREFLRSGKLGKIGMVRAFVHSGGRPPTQPTPQSDPPPGLDWDFWCGPAPLRPYEKTMHPRGFRQYLDFANGTLGDWGVHWFDQILWCTEEKHPRTVYSTGARHLRADSTDAPDTQVATYEFESFTVAWEHRQYGGNNAEKHPLGAYFYGSEGTFFLGWRDGWTFYPSAKGQAVLHEEARVHTPDAHNIPELWEDMLAAIREKRRPVCDIETSHHATNMSLLGMISWRVGRSLRWDGVKERIEGDPEANKLLRRDYRGPWRYPEV